MNAQIATKPAAPPQTPELPQGEAGVARAFTGAIATDVRCVQA